MKPSLKSLNGSTLDDSEKEKVEAFVKKIKYGRGWVELHSFNPYYPVRRFEGKEANEIRVVGLVIEVSRKL